jgi:hypothetical protein
VVFAPAHIPEHVRNTVQSTSPTWTVYAIALAENAILAAKKARNHVIQEQKGDKIRVKECGGPQRATTMMFYARSHCHGRKALSGHMTRVVRLAPFALSFTTTLHGVLLDLGVYILVVRSDERARTPDTHTCDTLTHGRTWRALCTTGLSDLRAARQGRIAHTTSAQCPPTFGTL